MKYLALAWIAACIAACVASCSGPGAVGAYQEPGFATYCQTHAGIGDCP